MINKNMETNKAKMSDESKIRSQLDAVKEAYGTDYGTVERSLTEGMSGLKSRIRQFNVELQEKVAAPKKLAGPKYSMKDIADRAVDTYKTRINPVNPEFEEDEGQPSTHATRTSMKAMANSLAGLRSSGNAGKMTQNTPNGNGDLGQYTSPANNNDGDLGNNTAYGQYYALTTNMSLEQYQEHINNKFIKEEPSAPLVCGVCAEDPCQCEPNEEGESPIEELQERLLQLDDSAWQSIDLVMREFAHELEVEPKELHRAFKAETGLIPDDWLKENREVQLFGYMPLDEAVAINKIGQVYEVTCIWRGNTMRLKFFYPEMGMVGREEAQDVCDKFYPGSRLLAHYPVKDAPDNYMVIVPQVKESAEFVPLDTWEELDEDTSELYNQICEEIGEPLSPPVDHEDGNLKVLVSDHDTGEEVEVVFEKKGLWDNIHAKRKRGEKAAKPGDKDYPKTLNIEETEQDGPAPTGKQRRSAINDARRKLNLAKHDGDKDAESLHKARLKAFGMSEDLKQAKKNVGADSCWDGYKAKGTKKKDGKEVPNCVKEGDEMKGMSQKSGDKRSTDSGAGMTAKGVAKYNSRTGGNLKTAVTTPPSKLKPGSKAAGRRKSFCARSRGWNGERGKAARRRWNC